MKVESSIDYMSRRSVHEINSVLSPLFPIRKRLRTFFKRIYPEYTNDPYKNQKYIYLEEVQRNSDVLQYHKIESIEFENLFGKPVYVTSSSVSDNPNGRSLKYQTILDWAKATIKIQSKTNISDFIFDANVSESEYQLFLKKQIIAQKVESMHHQISLFSLLRINRAEKNGIRIHSKPSYLDFKF